MRKSLLLAVCSVSVLAMTSVQAIEIKKPDVGALKNVSSVAKGATATTTTTKTDKSAADEAFQKQFQATIDSSKKQLTTADAMANKAIWDLGAIVLDKEAYEGFVANKNVEGTTDALIKAMNATLKTQLKTGDIDNYSFDGNSNGKIAYANAVKNLQIAQNRRANITNNMSPNFKKILDGEVSLLNVKAQLAESTKLAKDVKSASMGQQPLLNKLNKINEKQKIVVTVPDNEKVKYNKDGIVGSINYQLDTTNETIKSAYNSLISAYNLNNEVNAILADMNNDANLSKAEKDQNKVAAQEKAFVDYAKAQEAKKKAGETVAQKTAEQQKALENAGAKLAEGISSYTALGISCTKLGLQISSKPILAAPLALEVDQLKHTAKMLKTGAASLKNTIGAINSLK